MPRRPGAPWGTPRGCPSAHARHGAPMSPRALSLSGGTKQRWCPQVRWWVTPLPSPMSLRRGPGCSIQLSCAWGPGLPGTGRRVSAGTWAPSDGPMMLPRPPEGQAPPCPPPRGARSCCGCVGSLPASGPAARAVPGEEPAACPPRTHFLAGSQPAGGLWREHVLFWVGRSRRMCRGTQWTTLSGSAQPPPWGGADAVSSSLRGDPAAGVP